MALDPRQLEAMAAHKDANRRHQLIANKAVIANISERDGKVRVWHFAEKRWKSLWPVDAAEQIRLGIAALSVTPMRGPAGEIMVATDAVEDHRVGGYRLLDEPDPEPAADPKVIGQTADPKVIEQTGPSAAAQTEQPAADPKDAKRTGKAK